MSRKNLNSNRVARVLLVSLMAALIFGCSPRVALEVPDKPITINLNIKIDHEVRVKIEKDLDKVLSKNSDLF